MSISRRSFLLGTGALALGGCWASIKGCDDKATGPSNGSGGGNGGGSVNPLLGYGIPNAWNTQSPTGFARILASYGIGATVIELRPNSLGLQEAPLGSTESFLKAIRGRGIHAHVFVVNWNCRSSGPCPTAQEVGDSVRRLASFGTDGVSIEVAEPSDSPEEQRSIALAREAWPGEFYVNWGFPFPSGLSYNGRSIHECNPDPSGWAQRPDVLHVTDCHASLTRNARAIGEWARATNQRVILYDVYGQSPDLTVLQELKG